MSLKTNNVNNEQLIEVISGFTSKNKNMYSNSGKHFNWEMDNLTHVDNTFTLRIDYKALPNKTKQTMYHQNFVVKKDKNPFSQNNFFCYIKNFITIFSVIEYFWEIVA